MTGRAGIDAQPSRTDVRGRVTFGVTSLNEERTIGPALEVVLAEASEVDAQVVVVAGGSDRTSAIAAEKLSGRTKTRLIVDSAPKGKPAALNELISKSDGDVIILTDGDILVRRGSSNSLLGALRHEDVGCAGGRVMGAPGQYNQVEKACDLMTEMMHLSRRRRFLSTGSIDIASGNLIAVKRELLPVIPEDTNSDDGYISLWVRSMGKRIAYVETAVALTSFPKNMSDFLSQKVRTRYGHLQLMAQFSSRLSRTIGSDFREFSAMRALRKSKGYGPGTSALALALTGISWFLAYVRFYLPWLSRKRIWTPVSSTK